MAFKNLLKLPSPGTKYLSSKEWKEWHGYLKKEYPIRYFLLETLPLFFLFNFKRPTQRVWDWIIYHTIRRYHMLDLRQPNGYRYGWCDTDGKMKYALFNLLDLFVKNEFHHLWFPTEEEIQQSPADEASVLMEQRQHCMEIKAIHTYWTVDRLEEEKQTDQIWERWKEARETFGNDHSFTQEYFRQINEAETKAEEKLTEMMIRLVKIRGALWT